MKHSYSFFGKKSGKTIAIVASSMTVAFILGIETAGDVKPVVTETRAGNAVLRGDMNGDGTLDLSDVRIALELAEGKRSPTPDELAADPNQDFVITKDDVTAIADAIEHK